MLHKKQIIRNLTWPRQTKWLGVAILTALLGSGLVSAARFVRARHPVQAVPALAWPAYKGCFLVLGQVAPYNSLKFNWQEGAENMIVRQSHERIIGADLMVDCEYTHRADEFAGPRLLGLHTDLNGDGQRDLLVHCSGKIGPAGNGPSGWVYLKTKSGYQKILGEDNAQMFSVQPTITNGFRDIATYMQDKGSDGWAFLYRYNGRQYRLSACFYSNYRYQDTEGKWRETAQEQHTPFNCTAN